MTICIGLIPNERTVMLMQDSEISYERLGFTQDIFNKIKVINNDAIVGVIGNPLAANEVLELVTGREYKQSRELRGTLEDAYHAVRKEKLLKGVLKKYGFSDLREVLQPQKETAIDPAVREEVLKAANDYDNGMGLTMMLATNLEQRPQLYQIVFPGRGALENNVKMYTVSGSGTIMALDKMGEELEKYKWQPKLSIDEGIDVLLRAGKASEKHAGVGGPFDITYITRGENGQNEIVKPDQKKINMVVYLFPLHVKEKILIEAIVRMRDEKVSAGQLADYIKTNTKVGIEFDNYFNL